MRLAPTAAQQPVLDAIREHWARNGYPPAVRDLCAALGGVSTSTIQYHLGKLEERGWIERDPYVARSIRLVEGERARYTLPAEDTECMVGF